MKRLIIACIRVYQWCISPLLPPHCRFEPTCSSYAVTAVQRFGAWRGSVMALRRLLRCHPFSPGGCDPVPGSDQDHPGDRDNGCVTHVHARSLSGECPR